IERPAELETTALGAAFLAGLATGLWPDLESLTAHSCTAAVFEPRMQPARREMLLAGWRQALARALLPVRRGRRAGRLGRRTSVGFEFEQRLTDPFEHVREVGAVHEEQRLTRAHGERKYRHIGQAAAPRLSWRRHGRCAAETAQKI